MQYKGKTLITPPLNTKYIPVVVRSATEENTMGISDIQLIGNTKYARIGDDTYLWTIQSATTKDASVGNMCDLYSTTFKTMTSVPDQLDLGERTDLSRFFSDTPRDVNYTDDGFDDYIQDGDGGCRALLVAPMMDTSRITNMSAMFGYETTQALYDMSTRPPASKTFENINACVSMTSIPQYNTSNVTNFQGMFAYCSSLTAVPLLDLSSAENVSYMFQGCTSLPKVFPWVINFDNLVESGKNDVNKFKGMFEGSSVEEITIMMDAINEDENYVYNSETGDFDEVLTITPENLDSTGTLKKINVLCPDYNQEIDENAQYNAEHYLVRVRQDN